MLAEHITAALGIARGRSALDDVSRVIWKGLAEGLLSENEAQRFADQLEALRRGEGASRGEPVRSAPSSFSGASPGRRHSFFPPRRKQVSPDRRISLARRKRLAASGPVPPSLAAHFTTSELAVLRIIGDEWRGEGACVKTLAEVAARAGVSRTTVQNAIRQARAMGMLKVEERRVMGAKSLPNKITVVCAEWKTWLRRGPPREKSPHRVQKSEPHRYQYPTREKQRGSKAAYPTNEHTHIPWNVSKRTSYGIRP